TLGGRVYHGIERLLIRRGDLYLFESAFSAERFNRKVGTAPAMTRVVYNGVSASEFEPVPVRPDATDLVFIGELRLLKGVDILIDAIALLRDRGRVATLTMVGDGPGREAFRSQAERL